PRGQRVERVAEQENRHVRVEPVQLVELHLEAPLLRIPVRHGDDLRLISRLVEELLPLRDELLLREHHEQRTPPRPSGRRTRRGGYSHLSLPSTEAIRTRAYR